MGRVVTPDTYRKAETQLELIERFAGLMREHYAATLYVFGSRARGTATPLSDYDLVAVSDVFRARRHGTRVPDRLSLWLEAGGWGEGLDLHCYSPEEFLRQTRGGLGYLGQSWARGELLQVGDARQVC